MSDGITCPKCGSDKVQKQGKKRGRQMIQCQVCSRYSILPMSDQPVVAPTANQGELAGCITLAHIIEKFDIPAAIRRELAVLPRGKLILEAELSQRTAGKDRSRFRRAVENNAAVFKPFRIQLRLDDGEGKWYWGGASDIEEAARIYNG